MTRFTLWTNPERPADAPRHVRGCWTMAELAHDQQPLNVRVLWDGDSLRAFGGVVDIGGDGLAFAYVPAALPRRLWREILPALLAGLYGAHERGLRRIFAIVAARHAEGLRLVKHLGFEFFANDDGYPQTDEPMLRYVRTWPALEEPALVRHQRRELELACLGAWCPALAARGAL